MNKNVFKPEDFLGMEVVSPLEQRKVKGGFAFQQQQQQQQQQGGQQQQQLQPPTPPQTPGTLILV